MSAERPHIEGTEYKNQWFRGKLFAFEDALTKAEIDKARKLPVPRRGVHHPKTPLPIPKQ